MIRSKCFLAILLLIGFIGQSCKDEIEKTDVVIDITQVPTLAATNVESFYTERANMKGKFEAPVVNRYEGVDTPYAEFPEGIIALQLDSMQHETSSLKSDYAHHNLKTNLWTYKGNVKVKNTKGDRLETDLLYVDREDDTVYTHTPTMIYTADGSELPGEGGFRSDLSFDNYEVIGKAE